MKMETFEQLETLQLILKIKKLLNEQPAFRTIMKIAQAIENYETKYGVIK